MPDYLITTCDGSQYLMHHGVKGMKWGKWNAETAAKYSGTKRNGLSPETKEKLKTAGKAAAIGLGTAAVIGGAAYGVRKFGGSPVAKQMANKIYDVEGFKRKNELSDFAYNVTKNEVSRNAADKAVSDYVTAFKKAETLQKGVQNFGGKNLARHVTAAGVGAASGYLQYKRNAKQSVNDVVSKAKNKSVVQEHQEARKSFDQRRLESAAKAQQKDADDLKKAGFKEEGEAVQKVADNTKNKLVQRYANEDLSKRTFTDKEIERMSNGASLEEILDRQDKRKKRS